MNADLNVLEYENKIDVSKFGYTFEYLLDLKDNIYQFSLLIIYHYIIM
jgi:hypothetical protein